MTNHRARSAILLLGLAAEPGSAWAQDSVIEASDTGDTAWLLAATALLLLAALPGLALFHAGRARVAVFTASLVQAASVAAAVSLAWIVVGFTLAFGDVTSGWLGGGNAWMLIELGNIRSGLSVPESAFALFQIAGAALAAMIMLGAWSGRARFGWVILFSVLWSLVVLAPITHWLLGGGWLAESTGAIDFAGGLTVCISAGTSALVTATLMGRGLDFDAKRRSSGLAPVALAGGLLMWIGWLGLSGGAAFRANDDAAAALVSAHAAACAGALARLAFDRLRGRAAKAEAFACGLVSGLAAIAPAALYVSPGAAIVIGALGSAVAMGIAPLIHRVGIDDRLQVFAIFGAPAITGALLLAPFMLDALGGTGYAEDMNPIAQLVAQAIGIVVVMVWSAIGSTIIALMASLLFPMRVSEAAEQATLDPAPPARRT